MKDGDGLVPVVVAQYRRDAVWRKHSCDGEQQLPSLRAAIFAGGGATVGERPLQHRGDVQECPALVTR